MMNSDSENCNKRKSDKWKKNMPKKKRNSGEAYISAGKGPANVPRREMSVEVNCKCKLSCRTLRPANRSELFRQFRLLADYEKQQDFLARFVHPQVIQRRRLGTYDQPSESRRQHTVTYFLPLPGGSEVRVCQKVFCNTFGVTPRRIQLLVGKILAGATHFKDKRGGARTAKKNEEWKAKIVEHIGSFPTMESHYPRKNSDKLFLSPDLNVNRMYCAFVEKYCSNYAVCPVSRQWYHQIFQTNFNLRFRALRVDTCSTRDKLAVRIKNGGYREASVMQELHHRKAESAANGMKSDCENAKQSDAYVVSFDMQQQMNLPQLIHIEMYYSRQIACQNLGMHDSDKRRGHMCLWTEDVGGRVSLEIAHCLFTYLTTEVSTQKKKLILWSDNCAGQNKNQILLAMYLTLLCKGIFAEIIHKFPVKVHTFLDCDRDFAVIERRKKRCTALTLKDIISIITESAIENPFIVTVMTEFIDFKALAREKLSTGKLKISSASQIKTFSERFGDVLIATSHSDIAVWSDPVNFLKPGVRSTDFLNFPLVASRTRFGLPDNKKKDIRNMLDYVAGNAKQFLLDVLNECPEVVSENQ